MENGTLVFRLEDDGKGREMYKTWTEYSDGKNFYRTSPVYQVWQNDKWLHCGMDYNAAYRAWEKGENL